MRTMMLYFVGILQREAGTLGACDIAHHLSQLLVITNQLIPLPDLVVDHLPFAALDHHSVIIPLYSFFNCTAKALFPGFSVGRSNTALLALDLSVNSVM